MNPYPAYPDAPSSAPAQNSASFSDPRLPPRPAFPPPPGPVPHQQHRNSFDRPAFAPPQVYPYQSGAPASLPRPPNLNHAGPSGYVNAPPPRDQRYGAHDDRADGRGPGFAPGNDQAYHPNHSGSNQAPPFHQQNGSNHRSNDGGPNGPYPTLLPIHFTDRQPPPFHRSEDHESRGYTGPLNNQSQNSGQGFDPSMSRGVHGRQENRRDPPRENLRIRDQSGRGRSPDSSRNPPRPLAERDRDARTIDHRMKLERACRTLFVRNVSYESDTDALRTSFEQYGQIKTYFDLVKQRGMIFITYYDLRAAGRARDGMHDSMIRDRKIDVHYSLPRDQDQNAPATSDSNQGSVVATLLRGPYLTENELGGMCEKYGEIKSVRPGHSPEQKVVEFYDARGAILFFEQMNNRPFRNGTLALRFIWDEPDSGGAPPPPAARDFRDGRPMDRPPMNGHPNGGPPGPGNGRRGRQSSRSRDRGGDRRNGNGGWNGPDGRGQHGGRGAGSGSNRGHGRRDSDVSHQGQRNLPGPPSGRYADAPPQIPGDDRLEQARKVQDLLNSLSGPGPALPPAQSGPPPPQNFAGKPPFPPPMGGRMPPPVPPVPYRLPETRPPLNNSGPPFPPPPGPYGGSAPQTYNYPAPISSGPNSSAAPNGASGIPPEVLSLLQANNVVPPPIHQQPAYNPSQNQGPATFAPSPPFRPPQTMPPSYGQNSGSQGYQNGHPSLPTQQQERGYQPGTGPGSGPAGSGDVGSLLAMLQQSRS